MAAATLSELYQIPGTGEDVFCARFSGGRFGAEGAEQQLLALGHGDGTVSLHGAATGRLFHTIPGHDWAASAPVTAAPASPSGRGSPVKPPPLPSTGGLPVTALRWRPEGAASAFKLSESTTARNVLLVASSDGTLRHVHAGSGRVLSTIVEEGTQIYAADYRGDARFFASAGNAKCVRVYDEETRALTVTLAGGQLPGYGYASVAQAAGEAPPANAGTGHSSRIFSVAWHPVEGEGNILASGGWDNTVQVWDMRVGSAVRSFYGPHLGGDGLCFTRDGRHLVTASWRGTNQLQIWDWASGRCEVTVPWECCNVDMREAARDQVKAPGGCMLYCAALARGGDGGGGGDPLLLVGGSGSNEARVLSVAQALALGGGAPAAAPLVATVMGLPRGVYTADWANGEVFVVAGGDAPTRVLRVTGAASWPPAEKAGAAGAAAAREGKAAGAAVWGPEGDAIALDCGAAPSPGRPVRPPRRVLTAAAAADAAASGGGGGGGGGDAAPGEATSEQHHPLEQVMATPAGKFRGGSAALRAVMEAREAAAAAAGGGGGGGGGGEGAEEEDGDDGDDEVDARSPPSGWLAGATNH